MLASKRCAGARGNWCATHASTHVSINGSPSSCTPSFRCSTWGYVITAVNAMKRIRVAARNRFELAAGIALRGRSVTLQDLDELAQLFDRVLRSVENRAPLLQCGLGPVFVLEAHAAVRAHTAGAA